MKKVLNKGFTLIELLVVIAIIGMLSSVVLSSLNTARGKAANSAIKANLNNIRPQAEIFYDGNIIGGVNSYAGLTSSAQIVKIRSAIDTILGITGSVVVNPPGSTWAASAPLKVPEVVGGSTFNYWCVDSAGTSRGHTNVLGSASACP